MNKFEFKTTINKTPGRSLYEYALWLRKHCPGKHYKEIDTPENRQAYLRDGYTFPTKTS
jgi:hypothetical protein